MPSKTRDRMKRFVDQALNDLERYRENLNTLDFEYQQAELEFNVLYVEERAIVLGLKALSVELSTLTEQYRNRYV